MLANPRTFSKEHLDVLKSLVGRNGKGGNTGNLCSQNGCQSRCASTHPETPVIYEDWTRVTQKVLYTDQATSAIVLLCHEGRFPKSHGTGRSSPCTTSTPHHSMDESFLAAQKKAERRIHDRWNAWRIENLINPRRSLDFVLRSTFQNDLV